MKTTNIGTFYQGQLIKIAIETNDEDTAEEKAVFANNEVYLGIYHEGAQDKMLFSTVDNTLIRRTLTGGKIVVEATITPTVSKRMSGRYSVEMLVKASDDSFANPSENILTFGVEARRLSSLIK